MTLGKNVRRALAGFLLSSAAITGLGAPMLAQSYNSDGLNIIGGIDSDFQLSYNLRNNNKRDTRAFYQLQVDGEKIQSAASMLVVTIPESFSRFRGRVDLERVRVRYGRIGNVDEDIAVDEIRWDDRVFSGANDLSDELDKIEIFLAEDIPAGRSFIIEFGRVRNPNRALIVRANLQVVPRGQELATYIGTWELLVAYEDRDSD